MKKALIFDAYDDYSIRIRFIQKALENAGYTVKIFFADFDHYSKAYVTNPREGVNYIPALSYKKNLSYARIHSHLNFSKDCVKKAEEEKDVSLIYVMAPPNSMVKEFSFYKEEHPEVKLWIDICDMWPESLPISSFLKKAASPILNIWKNYRNKYVYRADLVTLECNLFQEGMEGWIDQKHIRTLYLCQPKHFLDTCADFEKDELGILYCGSMNHIIDIDLMIAVLKKINEKRRCTLHIIGDGENKDILIQEAEKYQIPYQYYGRVYNEEDKRKIYQKCMFGLNLMKNSVFVGLTMKSLDYLSYGLPMINNIPADTHDLILDKKIGYNLSTQNIDAIAEQILDLNDDSYQKMCQNVHTVFEQYFDEDAVMIQLNEIVKELKGI